MLWYLPGPCGLGLARYKHITIIRVYFSGVGPMGCPTDRGGDSDWGTSGEWGIEWGIRCLPDHVILHTPPLILLNQDDVRKNPNQGVKKGECQFVIKVEPKGLDLFY